MSPWTTTLPDLPEVAEIARRVDADPQVSGVILTGSFAHGMSTDDCDVDLLVVLARPDDAWRIGSQDRVDLRVTDMRALRRVPSHPSDWWDRYRLSRGRVLLDRTEGAIPAALAAWGTLTAAEKADALDYYLDPYLTYSMRSLHQFGAGEDRAGHLDALEALPWALRLAFALEGRPRPTNRYLEWELTHYPFQAPGWDRERVLGMVDDLRRNGSPQAQRDLFRALDPRLRTLGFGGALDGYPKAMRYLRG